MKMRCALDCFLVRSGLTLVGSNARERPRTDAGSFTVMEETDQMAQRASLIGGFPDTLPIITFSVIQQLIYLDKPERIYKYVL